MYAIFPTAAVSTAQRHDIAFTAAGTTAECNLGHRIDGSIVIISFIQVQLGQQALRGKLITVVTHVSFVLARNTREKESSPPCYLFTVDPIHTGIHEFQTFIDNLVETEFRIFGNVLILAQRIVEIDSFTVYFGKHHISPYFITDRGRNIQVECYTVFLLEVKGRRVLFAILVDMRHIVVDIHDDTVITRRVGKGVTIEVAVFPDIPYLGSGIFGRFEQIAPESFENKRLIGHIGYGRGTPPKTGIKFGVDSYIIAFIEEVGRLIGT